MPTEPMPPAAKTIPRSAADAAEVVLDDVGQQHLGGAHEQQVGDRGGGERRPEPRVTADVAHAGPQIAREGAGAGHVLRPLGHREDGGRRGEEGERVEREGHAGARDRDEHAADRRPDQAQRDRTHEVVERVGLGELVGRQDLRRDRVERRAEERAARAVHRDEHDHVPELEHPGQGEQGHDPDRETAREVGEEHEAAPVEPVAQHAAEEQEGDRGDRHRDPDHRERGRRVGERVDLPGHRDHEHAVAHERDAHPAPEQPEVAVPQGREEAHPAQPAGAVGPLVAAMQHRRRAPCRRRRCAGSPGSRRPSSAGRSRSPGRARSRASRSASHCSGISMPSATTSRLSDSPSATTAIASSAAFSEATRSGTSGPSSGRRPGSSAGGSATSSRCRSRRARAATPSALSSSSRAHGEVGVGHEHRLGDLERQVRRARGRTRRARRGRRRPRRSAGAASRRG